MYFICFKCIFPNLDIFAPWLWGEDIPRLPIADIFIICKISVCQNRHISTNNQRSLRHQKVSLNANDFFSILLAILMLSFYWSFTEYNLQFENILLRNWAALQSNGQIMTWSLRKNSMVLLKNSNHELGRKKSIASLILSQHFQTLIWIAPAI